MKKNPTGTLYVPACSSNERKQPLDLFPEECRIKSTTDFYMFNTIACLCTTFLFPPLIIVAVYFLYKAKQKGGKR